MQSRELIGERLVSDSVLVELVAPNKQTQVLLRDAVVRFGEKYLVHWSGMRFARGLYGKRVDIVLPEIVTKRLMALK